MKLAAVVALGGLLLVAKAPAHAEQSRSRETHETIPHTYDGAGDAFRDGGHELGDGFRGLGLGVRDTFTGRRSGDDYRKSKAVGTGFKDIGRGIAGGARAVGHGIKRTFQGGNDQRE